MHEPRNLDYHAQVSLVRRLYRTPLPDNTADLDRLMTDGGTADNHALLILDLQDARLTLGAQDVFPLADFIRNTAGRLTPRQFLGLEAYHLALRDQALDRALYHVHAFLAAQATKARPAAVPRPTTAYLHRMMTDPAYGRANPEHAAYLPDLYGPTFDVDIALDAQTSQARVDLLEHAGIPALGAARLGADPDDDRRSLADLGLDDHVRTHYAAAQARRHAVVVPTAHLHLFVSMNAQSGFIEARSRSLDYPLVAYLEESLAAGRFAPGPQTHWLYWLLALNHAITGLHECLPDPAGRPDVLRELEPDDPLCAPVTRWLLAGPPFTFQPASTSLTVVTDPLAATAHPWPMRPAAAPAIGNYVHFFNWPYDRPLATSRLRAPGDWPEPPPDDA